MIEILSLPRRPKLDVAGVPNLTFKSGLPINSLPGWELIPLNSKLPMLKCPGNQVIFSKNKIGQSFKHLKQEFDPSVRESLPEYNPLHDSNLKTFYANERNLKRLRENGEITQDNDVICNLKDFNEYRQQLHRTRLYYVMQEINRQENEQHDRMLISNAEAITARDHHNLAARQNSFTEIQGRKRKLENMRAARFQKMWQRTQDKFARKAAAVEMEKAYHEYRKLLNHMKMQRHLEAAADLQRKQLIKLKKLFQFKQDRLQKNLRNVEEDRSRKNEIIQTGFWEKRLKERISYQDKMKILLESMSTQRQQFIEVF
ncbi:fibrous sheath-interacting protein 2-like [Eurosta solidaginis]|uniref:fibrous sheath-interacting protein 2-like n=1 Tax=Eurosta solidaginis TaxID=178769 RepID=UPI00353166CB